MSKKSNAELKVDDSKGLATLTYKSKTVRTLEGALKASKTDLDKWIVARHVINKWDVVAKVKVDGDGTNRLAATELWQVKVWLERKTPQLAALEDVLSEMEKKSKKVKLKKPRRKKKQPRRALELCIMDPHIGVNCFKPTAQHPWNPALAEQKYLYCAEDILDQASPLGPFEKMYWIVGNDFLHTDSGNQSTTAGTPMPGSIEHKISYIRGEQLLIATGDLILNRFDDQRLFTEDATLEIIQVSGNHDSFSSFTLGRMLKAYYCNDERVIVNASPEEYKKFRWGKNLIGLHHGNTPKAIRLGGVMVNTWKKDFYECEFHEWHCGDQHRKGSMNPVSFEELGVSIEYLPGLVPPDHWHKKQTYNFQKRAATGFVLEHNASNMFRLSTNLSKYTGEFL